MTGRLFKEASGNPLPLLELTLRTLARESLGFSFEEKMTVLLEGFVKNEERHEVHIAGLLQEMRGEYPVFDWFPVPKNSTLDSLHVDMGVLRTENEIVGLQVTSDGVHGKFRRKAIRETFYEGAIAVIATLGWEKEIKSDEILINNLRQLLSSDKLIKVNLG